MAREPRGPLQGLAELDQLIADHQDEVPTFVRGLVVGALVGAALAGSAVWRRWRGRNVSQPDDRQPES